MEISFRKILLREKYKEGERIEDDNSEWIAKEDEEKEWREYEKSGERKNRDVLQKRKERKNEKKKWRREKIGTSKRF